MPNKVTIGFVGYKARSPFTKEDPHPGRKLNPTDILPPDHGELFQQPGNFSIVFKPVPEISQETCCKSTAVSICEVIVHPHSVFMITYQAGIFEYLEVL